MTTRIEGMSVLEDRHDDDANLTEAERSMREEELTFYSNSTNDHGDDDIWGLLSGICGNVYEWYDFAVYGLLAPEIGGCFFPDSSKKLQLINSFGVYLAAFLMRPLGAIMFGEIGDRLVGRKHALVFSIVLITVPSILMGILPTYHTIGIAAPILLVILRMAQGLSVGGQLAGSYVLSVEQSSSRSRGFRGSLCDASSKGGFVLASAVTTLTRSILTKDQVNEWGWRLPFLFSFVLAPLLYVVVSNTQESKLWSEQQNENEETDEKTPTHETPAIVDLLNSPFRRRQLSGMIGILSACVASFYMLFLWTPVYLSSLRGILTEQEADLMNFCVTGCQIFFILMAGKLSDTFPHRMDLMRIGLPGIIVACPCMFALFESESWMGYLLAQLLFGFSLALIQGGMAAFEVELWMADPTLSFTGVAIGHNVAATLFGGTMPLVATFLYYRSNEMVVAKAETMVDQYGILTEDFSLLWPRLIPGFYVSALGCVSLYCLSYVVKHPHDVRVGTKKLKEKVVQQSVKKANKKKKKQQLKKAIETGDFGGDYEPPRLGTLS